MKKLTQAEEQIMQALWSIKQVAMSKTSWNYWMSPNHIITQLQP
jgi:hypothetical protein